MWKRSIGLHALAVVAAAALWACSDMGDPLTIPEPEKNDTPLILAVVPDSGAAGDTIRVDGENFGDAAGTVMLGSQSMEIAFWSNGQVRAVVPEDAATGSLRVQSEAGMSNPVSFRVRTPGGGGGKLPVIEAIVPLRTVAGDTLWISGSGFGNAPGGLQVEFASTTGRIEAAVLGWSDAEVMVEVPEGAATGDVSVTDGSQSTPGIAFELAPRLVSFRGDLSNGQGSAGILVRNACSSCHFDRPTGISGFSVQNAADVRLGGLRGAVGVPRHPEQSRLIRVMRGTDPLVPRMPDGGFQVPDEDIRVVEDWIYQGMRDN